ncbi:uncharacterized protein [Montipora capricornis]|uniref:uncharacterized protein n=1 Tax=Montipora foliosa TaxID=591990 RepID=UPI0035F18ABE
MDAGVVNAKAAQFFLNAMVAIQLGRAKNRRSKLIQRFRTLKKRRLRTMMALLACIELEKRKTKIAPAPEGPPKRIWVLQRDQYMFEELLAGNLPEETWYQNFHVSRKTFFKICDIVRSELSRQDTNMRPSVSLEKRVAVALNRLATGSCYTACGIGFGLPKSTANVVKNEFCDILRRKAANFIKFPKSEEEVLKVIKEFEHISVFPHVVGALDSTHIRIIAPKQNKYDFLGKKNFYSVLVLGVADSNSKFIHVSATPGAVSHAEMLCDGALQRDIENGTILNAPDRMIDGVPVKPLLVGNACFKLNPWLMKPYTQGPNMTSSQNTFNAALSSAREKIVQSFGVLRGRWRCLQETLKEDTFRVPTTVIACCVLHNLCIDVGDDAPVEQFVVQDDVEFTHDSYDDCGKHVREAISNYLDRYGY